MNGKLIEIILNKFREKLYYLKESELELLNRYEVYSNFEDFINLHICKKTIKLTQLVEKINSNNDDVINVLQKYYNFCNEELNMFINCEKRELFEHCRNIVKYVQKNDMWNELEKELENYVNPNDKSCGS